jgi:hypothetical protein
MARKAATRKPQTVSTDFVKAGLFYAPEVAEDLSRIGRKQILVEAITDDFYGVWTKKNGAWAYVLSSTGRGYYKCTLEDCSCPGWRAHHKQGPFFMCRHQKRMAKELSSEARRDLPTWKGEIAAEANNKLRSEHFQTPESGTECIDLRGEKPEPPILRIKQERAELEQAAKQAPSDTDSPGLIAFRLAIREDQKRVRKAAALYAASEAGIKRRERMADARKIREEDMNPQPEKLMSFAETARAIEEEED